MFATGAAPSLTIALVLATLAVVGLVAVHREALRRALLRAGDPRPLALFRISFALCLLMNLVEVAPQAVYLFSDEGLRSFYGVAERDASRELAALADTGSVDAFDYARRLGHRLGLACWIGPDVAAGAAFDALVANFDLLDGAESFVHPGTIASVRRSDYSAERAALGCVEHVIGEALDAPGRSELLSRISKNWDGVAEPDRTQGIARDVVLLHVATMTNLVAALGWTMVRVLHDGTSAEAVAAGDVATVNRRALESIRPAQGGTTIPLVTATNEVVRTEMTTRTGASPIGKVSSYRCCSCR